jgi:glutathione S-transferase
MKLYFNWNAVCAMKVVMCLEEKGLDYDRHHIDLARFDQLQDWYLALNPSGVVPTLVHDDAVLVESTIINEFLDDAYPAMPLKPKDPRARALMRWWGRQIDDVVHPSIRPLSFTRFVAPMAHAIGRDQLESIRGRMPKKDLAELWRRVAEAPYGDEELAEHVHKLDQFMERMEAALQKNAWLAGQELSLADLNVAPYFRRIVQLERTALWADRPAVAAWFDKIRMRKSYAMLERLRDEYSSVPPVPAAVRR